jgi:putative phosphoesterase
MATTIAVVADTHAQEALELPERCTRLLAGADLIIHAGDIASVATLAWFEAFGPPVHAVHGNVDPPELRRLLPEELEVEAGAARIGVVHDAGPSRGRFERLRLRFPAADAVVFGHSHMPLHERVADFQIFNPGSPTQRRRAPWRSIGRAQVEGSKIRFEHLRL